jgi:hypothetical protein
MVICHFQIIIVKDNEKWLLVFKNSASRCFLALAFNKKEERGKKTIYHPALYLIYFYQTALFILVMDIVFYGISLFT